MAKVLIIAFLVSFFILSPGVSLAAILYIDPDGGEYGRGDTFIAKIRIDSERQCINAAEVEVLFPADVLIPIDVTRGESIFTLWARDPVIDSERGAVNFAGGVPGGYCGRIPGDPGLTNVVAGIIFRVSETTNKRVAEISISDSTEVLLNDGLGSKAVLKKIGSSYAIAEEPSGKDEWFPYLRSDTNPPEPFEILLSRDDSVFGGRYFIIFSTIDKESGISHYEVMESDIHREEYVYGRNVKAVWKRSESPYLLDDQSLNSIIKVKAVDKAGNERIEKFIPAESMRQKSQFLMYAIGGLLLFALFTAAFSYFTRSRNKNNIS